MLKQKDSYIHCMLCGNWWTVYISWIDPWDASISRPHCEMLASHGLSRDMLASHDWFKECKHLKIVAVWCKMYKV